MSGVALFEHQQTGANYLTAHKHAYLGDGPGLGKTYTVLEAIRRRKGEHALVVAPAAVQTHWMREAAAMDVADRVQVFSYDKITDGGDDLERELLLHNTVDILVMDEAHFAKHAESQRTRRLLGRTGYARYVDTVWPASGTPVPKHAGEYWTVLATLFPEVARAHGIRTMREWREHFLVTVPMRVRGQIREKVIGQKNEPELRDIYAATMLRRTLADVGVDVPALWWQTLHLDAQAVWNAPNVLPQAHQGEILDRITLQQSLAEIEHDPEIARLRRRLGILKAPLVVDYLVDTLMDSDEKIVVFAYHLTVLETLKVGLADAGIGVVQVDGSTPTARRDDAIARFQEDATVRVFLGQNTAVGTGTDGLQKVASRAILVEPSWSAYENVQMGRRVARLGSTHDHAIVQMAVLSGTLDDAIVRQNLRETQMADAVGLGEVRT